MGRHRSRYAAEDVFGYGELDEALPQANFSVAVLPEPAV